MRGVPKRFIASGLVSVLDEGRYWKFGEEIREADDYEDPVAHVDDLENIPCRDLKTAFLRYHLKTESSDVTLHVITDGSSDEDLEYLPQSSVSFALYKKQLVMNLDLYLDVPDDVDHAPNGAARTAALLARKRMWIVREEEDWDDSGRWWNIRLVLGFHLRGRVLGALVRDGLEVEALLSATAGKFGRANVVDLLRGGFARALLGQPEGSWLEAKREHYNLREDLGQIKLARSVAQFANAPGGGLVVIGLATKQVDGVDSIHAVTPLPRSATIRKKYLQVLQRRLYPLPDDLSIELVEATTGVLMLIDVPPQPEELKPFLVHGAIVSGQANNIFVSVVERRDDEGIASSVASIHSALAVGRAFLRRGELPELP